MMRKATILTLCMLIAVITVGGFYVYGRSLWHPFYLRIVGKQTVEDVIASLGPEARNRMARYFADADVPYPPKQISLLALKDSALLEVWAGPQSEPRFIRSYTIHALSGKPGPKLREGDLQVPEGVYQIESFNPNSSYHLSLKLNYPNRFDLKNAQAEGRTHPGTNIFIHGKAVSIGCLAMGDEAIEELFVLAHDTGLPNIQVLIAPTDPRKSKLDAQDHPKWVADLYQTLENEFRKYSPSQ